MATGQERARDGRSSDGVAWPQARRAVSEAGERGADSVLELRERTALLRP